MSKFVELNTGQKMPILGLGTWQVENPEELKAAMNAALNAGYRHFDTSYNYLNENIIGEVIHEWVTSGRIKRNELFITTKLPQIGMNDTLVEHFLNKSLKNLKLDYVDLYLIHLPFGLKYVDDNDLFSLEGDTVGLDITTDHVKIWRAMEAQVKANKAKAIGLSNFNAKQIERIVKDALLLPAVLQVECHAYFQQKELRQLCTKHGIKFMGYAPFGSPGSEGILKLGVEGYVQPDILKDSVPSKIGILHGKSASQVLLRFLIQIGIPVIPKSVQPSRIKENAQIFDFELSRDEMKELEELDKGDGGRLFSFGFFPGADKHPEFPFK